MHFYEWKVLYFDWSTINEHWSCYHLIFNMGISISGEMVFILRRGPGVCKKWTNILRWVWGISGQADRQEDRYIHLMFPPTSWPAIYTYFSTNVLITHLPLGKMDIFLQTLFSDAISWMKSFVLWLKFYWSLFLKIQLTINQHWFR